MYRQKWKIFKDMFDLLHVTKGSDVQPKMVFPKSELTTWEGQWYVYLSPLK